MENGPKEKDPTPTINIYISAGEACDRLAILGVKNSRVTSEDARARTGSEMVSLLAKLMEAEIHAEDCLELRARLLEIHKRLWDVENEIREWELADCFEKEFIGLAREVYRLNDERSAIKKEIDKFYGHNPEVKEYAHYTGQGGQHAQKEETDQACSSGCPHSGG